MFQCQHPFGQAGRRVGWVNGQAALRQQATAINPFVNHMDRTTMFLITASQNLFMGMEAGMTRQQRRVDVDDAVAVTGDKIG